MDFRWAIKYKTIGVNLWSLGNEDVLGAIELVIVQRGKNGNERPPSQSMAIPADFWLATVSQLLKCLRPFDFFSKIHFCFFLFLPLFLFSLSSLFLFYWRNIFIVVPTSFFFIFVRIFWILFFISAYERSVECVS